MYRLGGSVVTSKKRVRRICRKILYETEYDPYVLSGIHKVPDKGKHFVRDLLAYHPDYIKADIYGEPDIFVDVSESPAFLIVSVRDDKYRVTISEALNHLEKKVNLYRRLYNNARRNIRRQTRAFLKVEIEKGVMCVLSSRQIEIGDAEVHHVTPFHDLFANYLGTLGLTPQTIPMDVSGLLVGWADYHRRHAVLCVLSKRAHDMMDKIPPRFQDMLAKSARKLSEVYDERGDDGSKSTTKSDVV